MQSHWQQFCFRWLNRTGIGLLVLLPCLAASAETKSHRVENLFYGRALFEYFQQNQLAAITTLLVAERSIQNQTQQDESDLLLADLYYRYGLYGESNHLFSRLLKTDSTPALRNRVWFNLARLYHEQGYFDLAFDLLSRIDASLPRKLDDEKFYLLTNLQLREGLFTDANRSSEQIDSRSAWQAYSRYNIGVNLIENKRFDEGEPILDQIIGKTADSDEMLALRDQANLSLGLSQLRRNNLQGAANSFERVRLQSPLTQAALLAAGRAWDRLDLFDKALPPWLELAQRNRVDAPTQEALLAIPTALEQRKKPRQALQYYELAASQFDKQIQTLDQAITTIANGELVNLLYQNALLMDRTSFANAALQSTSADYLHILMASSEFQNQLRRYQDLLDIRATLSHWRSTLPTLSLMLAERRRSFQNKLPALKKTNDFARLNSMQQTRRQYANQLDQIQADNDYLSLANSAEKEFLARLNKVATGIALIADRQNIDSQKESYRLLNGLLHWQISTDYAPRLWAANKQLKALDQALTISSERADSLFRLTDSNQNLFSEFDRRIDGQDDRIDQLIKRVEALQNQQQNRINHLAIAAIEAQKQHLLQLRLNARYSLARLYDSLVTN